MYHSLRGSGQFLAHQIQLLKRFIKQSLSEIEEVQGESVDIEVIHESYAELMAANKDLIELHDEVEEY